MKTVIRFLLRVYQWFHPPCPACGSWRANHWVRAGAIDCPDCGKITLSEKVKK